MTIPYLWGHGADPFQNGSFSPLKFLFAKLMMPLKLLTYNHYSSHLSFSLQTLAHEAR